MPVSNVLKAFRMKHCRQALEIRSIYCRPILSAASVAYALTSRGGLMRQSYPFEAHVRAMIVIALLVVPLCLGSVISADASELRIERPIIGSNISGNAYIEPTGGSKILEAKVYLDSRYVAAGPPYIIPLNTTQLTHGHHRLTVDNFSGPNLGRTSDILDPDLLIL